MYDTAIRKKLKIEELIGTNKLEITSPVFFMTSSILIKIKLTILLSLLWGWDKRPAYHFTKNCKHINQ